MMLVRGWSFSLGVVLGGKLVGLIEGAEVYVPALVVSELFYVLCRKVGGGARSRNR
ncbi:MAG: hypothetical protein QXH00_09695 [Candidatus Jordarchaeales archaeon]